MKDFAGSPGTVTGLALRISQCIFAAGSVAFMVSSPGFYKLPGFSFLFTSMLVQVTWSFGIALLDMYALMKNIAVRHRIIISLCLVGDWVTGTISLSAASASAGITILYFSDAGECVSSTECSNFQFAVVLAFLSWIMIHTSSLIMFWLLASSG